MNNLMPLLLAATLSAAVAQDNPPPPKPPLVRASPAGSEWSLEVKNLADGGKPAAPSEVAGRQMARARFEMRIGQNAVQQGTITFPNGATQTFYVVGDRILQKHDNADDIAVLPLQDGPLNFFEFRRKGFPALGWVTLRDYIGVETIEKQICYKYQLQNTAGLELPDDCVVTAWIRVGDGFPQRVQVGDIVYEFSQIRPFSQDVALPPPYQALVENLRAEERRLNALKSASKN
jgi:hypothetical protein